MRCPRPALRAGLVLALAVGAAATLAAADGTWKGEELERLWRNAAWKIGPFRIQPSLVVSNAGVDSNIYYAPTEPIKDFTLTAGPAATVYLPLGRKFILSGYASPQYVYYVKTERERTWNYFYSGSAALNLRRVFISVDRNYSDARQRFNTEIDVRPRRKEDGWAGTFLLQTSRRTSLELAWRQAKYDYENLEYETFNVREQLNHKETYYNVAAYYQRTSRTRYFLDFEYGEFRFDFAETALLKDSRSKAAYAGFEFSPLGRIRGMVRLGYKQFDVLSDEGEDFRGLVGDTQVALRVVRPLWLRASYRRDVRFSLWYSNAYYVENMPGVGASFYILRFVRLDYNYAFGRNDYPLTAEVDPGLEVKRRDDIRVHSAGIYFRIKGNVALGFIGSRWVRDSNLDREDDKRYFYGLNLVYDF